MDFFWNFVTSGINVSSFVIISMVFIWVKKNTIIWFRFALLSEKFIKEIRFFLKVSDKCIIYKQWRESLNISTVSKCFEYSPMFWRDGRIVWSIESCRYYSSFEDFKTSTGVWLIHDWLLQSRCNFPLQTYCLYVSFLLFIICLVSSLNHVLLGVKLRQIEKTDLVMNILP